jgi:site-specific DNA recombinase
MKQFAAFARVSSREQEREGYSLAVQEDALNKYAVAHGGRVVKLFRVAETASKTDERTTFKELLAYAKANAETLDGILFYKIDRAARNLADYVELETIESEYGVPFISASQPMENNPAGRMMRRTLANMASFFTEQQQVDVREGQARRVQDGWFVGKAPYGYKNHRVESRGLVKIDPQAGDNVSRIFHLFAYQKLTLDALVEKLQIEGRTYRPSLPNFTRSKVWKILTDRAYIGEVEYQGNWHPGKHEPLVDRKTWERVQAIMNASAVYKNHDMAYAGELITCGECGKPITGERKTKSSSTGDREYTYYRCARYTAPGHPRVRVNEAKLDAQVLEMFESLRIKDEDLVEQIKEVIQAQHDHAYADAKAQRLELHRMENLLISQEKRLVDLYLNGGITMEQQASKATELRDRLARVRLQMEALDRSRVEVTDIALKVFELSQNLRNKWFSADPAAKRAILQAVCLNWTLNGVTLCGQMNKPFDLLAEGLDSLQNRGDRI